MQIKYVYSNGISKIHSTFVKPKTVIKECGNAKQVKLYKYKKVYCLNNNTLYNSCQDAEKHLNLVKNTVSRVARGERKSIHNYKFVYATV